MIRESRRSLRAVIGVGGLLVASILTLTSAPVAFGAELRPQGPIETGWVVERVVDGDTLAVRRAGQRLRVRLIGIDTPETVRPDAPVQCFGPQSSAFARQALEGRSITLEFDPSQGRVDRFGRTLAYVWTIGSNPEMFNREAVAAGVAREYTYAGRPYAWQRELRAAEQSARRLGLGLWGACAVGR